MAKLKLPRLFAIAIPCLALSAALAVQALSSISTRSAPAQSVSLFAANGLAYEQLAFQTFQSQVNEGLELQAAAQMAQAQAEQGLVHDPLSPKSYAILAMASDDPERRSAILQSANRLNRRDISLQGLVLQEHIEQEDYRGVVSTLDQLLRVHPGYAREFYPLLVDVLQNDEAAPLFPDIMNGGALWHENFLLFAARDSAAQPNLASIRSQLNIENDRVDRLLISGLVRQGEEEAALSLYNSLRVPRPAQESAAHLDWEERFPPYDWELAAERDFRSQPGRDGSTLELYARSGQGGTIARRIISAPSTPINISTNMAMRGQGRSDAVRLILRCTSSQDAVIDEPLAPGDNSISVATLPNDCQQLTIEINARALRGEPTLRAELEPISIEGR